MGMWSGIRQRFMGFVRPEDSRYSTGRIPVWFIPQAIKVSTQQMLSNPTVYRSIREIVDNIASQEVRVFEVGSDGSRKHLTSHPAARCLNKRANPHMTALALKQSLITSAILYGAGYAEIRWDNTNRHEVKQIWPLRAENMQIQLADDGESFVYVYTQPQTGEVKTFEEKDIVHVRGPVLPVDNIYEGDSVFQRAESAVTLATAMERFATMFFQNNAQPGGYLKAGPGKGLSAEERDTQVANWIQAHSGPENAGKVAALGGGWEWVPSQIDVESTQLVEARQHQVEEIARVFGVPLVLLGVAAAAQGYGTNVSELLLQFVRGPLAPWIVAVTEELSYKLLEENRELEIDVEPLIRGNALQAAQADQIRINSGVKNPAECRAEMGRNGYEGADQYFMASNVTTVEKLLAPPPEPPAPAPVDSNPNDPLKEAQTEVLTEAVTNALDSHSRRVKARAADLRAAGKSPQEVEENLADLSKRAFREVATAFALAQRQTSETSINSAIAAVAHAPAAQIAQHLVTP